MVSRPEPNHVRESASPPRMEANQKNNISAQRNQGVQPTCFGAHPRGIANIVRWWMAKKHDQSPTAQPCPRIGVAAPDGSEEKAWCRIGEQAPDGNTEVGHEPNCLCGEEAPEGKPDHEAGTDARRHTGEEAPEGNAEDIGDHGPLCQ